MGHNSYIHIYANITYTAIRKPNRTILGGTKPSTGEAAWQSGEESGAALTEFSSDMATTRNGERDLTSLHLGFIICKMGWQYIPHGTAREMNELIYAKC